jgi:hypothetical protein
LIPGFPESGRPRIRTGWTGRVRSGRSKTGRVGSGRVGSSMSFFQIVLPAPVLDLSVLTDHEYDRFKHGSGQIAATDRTGQV